VIFNKPWKIHKAGLKTAAYHSWHQVITPTTYKWQDTNITTQRHLIKTYKILGSTLVLQEISGKKVQGIQRLWLKRSILVLNRDQSGSSMIKYIASTTLQQPKESKRSTTISRSNRTKMSKRYKTLLKSSSRILTRKIITRKSNILINIIKIWIGEIMLTTLKFYTCRWMILKLMIF